MLAFRRPARSRPIRVFLISMYVVPLVSLLGMWAFAADATIAPALTDYNFSQTTTAANDAIDPLSTALARERQETYLLLLTHKKSAAAALITARRESDGVINGAQDALGQDSDNTASSSKALAQLDSKLEQIASVRKQADSGVLTPEAAFVFYDDVVDQVYAFLTADAQDRPTTLVGGTTGAVDGEHALEMARRETALINGALASGSHLAPAARELFIATAAQRKQYLAQSEDLVPGSIPVYSSISTPAYQQFVTMETQIADAPGTELPVQATAWKTVTTAFLGQAQEANDKNDEALAAASSSHGSDLITEAVLAGALSLLVVLISAVVAMWFARKVSRDMARLNTSVRQMADERLPSVVARLRKGIDVDVDAESPPLRTSTIREVTDITESFATVQGAAIAAAVDQARLRTGVNQLFLNISMRNQSLLHRQLGMLDAMERQMSDPGALAELFRLDHLTTRMRRHAEGLIILAGSTPGRGWRTPVPVLDVLRAAVAEIEDYVRVDVVSDSRDTIAGNAVSDVTHLIAELVENATVFSPPHTHVEVRAERVGTGLVVEIEDRGLGLTGPERAEINARLATPPEFDLAASDQLGLFIVSQLAARHEIGVSLRESVYGGTTAIVRLPFGVIVREEDAATGDPGATGDDPADGEAPSAVAATSTTAAATTATAVRQDPGSTVTGRTDRGAIAAPGTAEAPAVRPPGAPDVPGGGRPSGPVSSGTHLGMPIRVPQASMAAQLRGNADAQPPGHGGEVDQRAPESTRDLMNLMQEGWRRGRVDDLDDPMLGAPGNEDAR